MRHMLTIMLNSVVVLSLTAISLAAFLGVQVYEYNNRVAVKVPQIEKTSNKTSAYTIPKFNALHLPTLASTNNVLERPLFNPGRKAIKSEQQDNGVTIQQTELSRKWMLTGVVIAKENSMAMLKERNGPDSIKLKLDMKVDGWQLHKVSPYNAILISNGREVVLPLYEKK